MDDIWRNIRSAARSERITPLDWVFLGIVAVVAVVLDGPYERAQRSLAVAGLIAVYYGVRWMLARANR